MQGGYIKSTSEFLLHAHDLAAIYAIRATIGAASTDNMYMGDNIFERM